MFFGLLYYIMKYLIIFLWNIAGYYEITNNAFVDYHVIINNFFWIIINYHEIINNVFSIIIHYHEIINNILRIMVKS
jgi:hypothetical protein